ncbi:arsenate reductase (glutaredoxin) [Pacificimonas flava]|uniref:Arsenate reductase (Glutaredoxin) n=2 Tax=Pacificimonas TaxID=1960290 RepID=A0A219B6U5_9SPHN|nr:MULTISPECIES: arsenate reductase family protein [Pacificimonas]MBZ6379272.1 arsenate reductase family protein [Pacificimonas aurantium]OWV33519.1 arsenate reductase (glutaredoxin) [Pacificimonas flava]
MVTLWFNPRCGTARNVRAWLEENGIDYELRDYQKDPPSRAEIEAVLDKGDMKPSHLLRAKEQLAADLGVRGSDDEEAVLSAMAEHPILINRPVVITADDAKLCRPADTVAEFLG